MKRLPFLCVFLTVLLFGRPAAAQGRDSLLNGAIVGAAVGAGAGIALTHAVRDSDLSASQYAYGAAVFGAIGAGVGLGVDALLSRSSPGPSTKPRRLLFAPVVWRDVARVTVTWRWSEPRAISRARSPQALK